MGGVFDIPASVVVAGVACTWCGVEIDAGCREKDGRRSLHTHAQRWRDYWNATHDRRDWIPVYLSPWLGGVPTTYTALKEGADA